MFNRQLSLALCSFIFGILMSGCSSVSYIEIAQASGVHTESLSSYRTNLETPPDGEVVFKACAYLKYGSWYCNEAFLEERFFDKAFKAKRTVEFYSGLSEHLSVVLDYANSTAKFTFEFPSSDREADCSAEINFASISNKLLESDTGCFFGYKKSATGKE